MDMMAGELEAVVDEFLRAADEGVGLGELDRSLIQLGLAACATALDVPSLNELSVRALAAGADEELLVEVLMLVSCIGVHALHEGVIALNNVTATPELGADALAQRRCSEGSSSYWARLEAELPGFLQGLAGRAPWAYDAFMAFVSAAAAHGRLTPLQRELIWASVDATPTHRYLPGLRLHLDNAVRLGATQSQLARMLELASAASEHDGVSRHMTGGT